MCAIIQKSAVICAAEQTGKSFVNQRWKTSCFPVENEEVEDWNFHLENILQALPLATEYVKNKVVDNDDELKKKMTSLKE